MFKEPILTAKVEIVISWTFLTAEKDREKKKVEGEFWNENLPLRAGPTRVISVRPVFLDLNFMRWLGACESNPVPSIKISAPPIKDSPLSVFVVSLRKRIIESSSIPVVVVKPAP